MRADEALKKNKRIKVVGNDGSIAQMDGGDLFWDNGARIAAVALWECDWEPADCSCEVCEARNYLEDTPFIDPQARLSVGVLCKNVRCEREHN